MAPILCVGNDRRIVGRLRESLRPSEFVEIPHPSNGESNSGVSPAPILARRDFDACLVVAASPDPVNTVLGSALRTGVPVIVVLPRDDARVASACIRAGAYDCLSMPIRGDEIRESVAGAVLASWHGGAGSQCDSDEQLRIPAIDALLNDYAASSLPVFITGESGVGKEVAAELIHRRSSRSAGPFIPRNCAATPDTLFETDFFGCEAGAYTGAVKRSGAFELAAGGTIFIDEVGDLPLEKQASLLRVLEERNVRKVGGTRQIPVDFRLVTATNRNLEHEIAAGTFRADLFYRIHVLPIRIPPLRERVNEIPELCYRFACSYAKKPLEFSPSAVAMLQQHSWPGNIRELRNVVQRISVISREKRVTCNTVREAFRVSSMV